VILEVLSQLDPARQSALDTLVARSEEADQHPALAEDLYDGAGRIDLHRHGARAVLAVSAEMGDGGATGELVGCATLTPAADGVTSLQVVVDPAHREHPADGDDVRTTLITRALAESARPVRLWIMQAGEGDDPALAALGFRPERDLLQMRVALPLPADIVAATRAAATRSFVTGRDDEAWLRVNNRSFAGHPEQGNWTLEKLREREAAEWFDPAGFLVVDGPGGADGPDIVGSCWTKVHRHRQPMLGEIYVIAVDPSRQGKGWGRALTVAGLQWLSAQGLQVGMLYTDASNTAAVALYESLGFAIDHVDRSYLTTATE
jgi:mycothiol synthase